MFEALHFCSNLLLFVNVLDSSVYSFKSGYLLTLLYLQNMHVVVDSDRFL